MNSRFIGGILLIVGTSIGGGMLALPVANAATGFWPSSLFLLLCWALMTIGAFFILEVNLYLPAGKNMVSMAAATLGKPGLLISWIIYLLLLYTLLAGYISGGTDVMSGLLKLLDIHISSWILAIVFTLIFGSVVYRGIRSVDLLNRGLMIAKLGAYLLLVFLIAPYISMDKLQGGDAQHISGTIMILITSYGFAIIVPNLRQYFNDDIKQLKKVIFIGSLIPLVCYIAWDAVIMGTLPNYGDQSLASLMHVTHPTSTLAGMLSGAIENTLISSFFNFWLVLFSPLRSIGGGISNCFL
jgi:tyrosine-specific transport protein